MFSAPPATTIFERPSRIASAASRMDWMPEPHAWLTVKAGRSSGMPERISVWRAMLGPPPACRAHP